MSAWLVTRAGGPGSAIAAGTLAKLICLCLQPVSVKIWIGFGLSLAYVRSQLSNGSAVTCLSRDDMRTRCRPGVRLSVYLSLWCIAVQTAEDIVKLLSRPGKPVILVFWSRSLIPNSKRAGGAKTRGYDNIAFFAWNRRLSRKRYEIDPWLLRNINRKS